MKPKLPQMDPRTKCEACKHVFSEHMLNKKNGVAMCPIGIQSPGGGYRYTSTKDSFKLKEEQA